MGSTLKLPFALPKPESEGSMKHTRTRYQAGSLTTEKRKTGSTVWIYRWRETNTSGKQVNRKLAIGDKIAYPNKTAALKAVEGLRLEINKEAPTGVYKPLSIGQLIAHYREVELADTPLRQPELRQPELRQSMGSTLIHIFSQSGRNTECRMFVRFW
jgi:hypothetical protein